MDRVCPLTLTYVETVPEGMRLTEWDAYSMFDFNWMKGISLIIASGDNAERTNLRMYFHDTREIWAATIGDGEDNADQINFMSALVKLGHMGAFD